MWIASFAVSSAMSAAMAAGGGPEAGEEGTSDGAARGDMRMPDRSIRWGFEPDPALPQELPPGFFRLLSRDSDRAGFPPFGRVGVTDARAAAGGWSLEFTLAGGAMAVVTEPELLRAGAGEIFEASVLVLQEAMERSGAELVVTALDSRGSPIDGAQWRGSAPRTRGWSRLRLRTGPMPETAKSLEVGLVVGPVDPGDPSGDVSGRVSFDELEVWRIPRIGVEIDRAGEPMGAPPRGAMVAVDDPVGGAEIIVRLFNQDLRELGRWTPPAGAPAAIEFPPLGPGCYRVDVEVLDGRPLSRVERGFAVADRRPGTERSAPGLVALGLWIDWPERARARSLLDSLILLQPDFVVIDLGDADASDPGRLQLAELRRWCDDLRLERVEPILRISRVPADLAESLHLEIDDPAGLFEVADDSWRRAYGAWLERFGHVVPRWMIASRPRRRVPVEARLDGLVPGWRELESTIQVIDADASPMRTTGDAVLIEGIRRWREGATMIALRGAIADEPGAAALAWASLADAARGARSSADLDAGSELGCLLLSCDASARVLVWRRDAGPSRAVTLPFDGDAMHAWDALGAPVELLRSRGAVTASVGSTPVIIDGVDPLLGRFLAGVRFGPAHLEGSTAEQTLRLEVMNPWDVTLEGTVRFVGPVEWSFIPRLQRFSLPPGGQGSVSTGVTLPRSQLTGVARVGVELEFTSDRGYSIRVDPAIEILIDAFTCEASMRRVVMADGRPGAVVEIEIENRSDRGLELESTVSTADGLARRDGPIRLEAGARARRTVRLDEAPAGPVTVSVSQTNGPLRLVRQIP